VPRKVLPDGEALTLRVEEEHQQVNELVAELDRIDARDLLDRGIDRAPAPLIPPGRAASRGLAALAGVIERVPGFWSGERARTSR
jgi:hypothetical protein